MKTKTKIIAVGIAALTATFLLMSFVSATYTDAPATGESALSSSQTSQVDSDQDGVSDYDEINIYGTDPLRESTDGDIYDDGQELFGFSPANYGNLGGQMPSYVKWPGNNPFVAAYPQIDFAVNPEFKVFIHKELHIANRTMVSVEKTTGTIVTRTVEDMVGVGSSHTVGGYQDASNKQIDEQMATTLKNTITNQQALTSQIDINSETKTKSFDWGVGGGAGVHAGAKMLAPIPVVYASANALAGVGGYAASSSKTVVEDKTIGLNLNGLTIEKQDGGSSATKRTTENTERTGATSSSTITETAMQKISTSISNVNLYTIGTAEEWETGWSQDTLDAAKLRFDLTIRNSGTDRTVGISDLRLIVKIGPYAKTFPSLDKAGITVPSMNPGDVHNYPGAAEVSLTLDELREFDTNGEVQIYVEDYNLGNSNEEAYALDAYEGGTLFVVDDGSVDDGSNLQYYLAHIEPYATYGDVLLKLNRTVPVGNPAYLQKILDVSIANGTMQSMAGLPVADNAAWFIQSEGISEKPFLFKEAKKGSKVIMTYSKDSDYDNYPDRVERKTGTNPNDLNSYPSPKVVAAYFVDKVELAVDNVTYEKTKPVFTLKPKITNIGNYDAYGAEIRLFSQNSEITATDEFSGGSVRIKPAQEIVLDDTLSWKPAAPGVQGATSFITNNPAVNVSGCGASLLSIDGNTATYPNCNTEDAMTISLSNGDVLYKARVYSRRPEFYGYQSFYSIDISADGKGWTKVASIGWSSGWNEFVFQFPVYAKYIRIYGQGRFWESQTHSSGAPFTINEFELYAYEHSGKRASQIKPVFETLYNDPQGSHRFLSATKIPDENASISEYANEMKNGLGLAISSPKKLTYAGSSGIGIAFTNPSESSIEKGKLFVAYQTLDGTVLKTFAKETSFQPGNTHFDFNLNTAEFGKEIIGAEIVVSAVATDYQGVMLAEQLALTEVENPVKIVNYTPGDVPETTQIEKGQEKQFAVFASSASQLAYKWFIDGVQIAGADSNNYVYKPFHPGNYTLKVIITDGTYENTHSWKIEITGIPNNPPILEPIADKTVFVGTEIIIWPQASDPDNDKITFEFIGNLIFTDIGNYTFKATPLENGTFPVSVFAYDENGANASQNFTVYVNSNAADKTPPANITNLNAISKTHNSIVWSWLNPSDSDFSHAEVWVNGTFLINETSNSIQVTDLEPLTIYEIQIRPVDSSGNIGNWTNSTAQTNEDAGGGGDDNESEGSGPGGGGGGGGGGGSSSGTPYCNIGYELIDGKCVLKKTALTKVDNASQEKNETESPKKPAVEVQPQAEVSAQQAETEEPSIITAMLTAVKKPTTIGIIVVIIAVGLGYWLFSRKYDLKFEVEK